MEASTANNNWSIMANVITNPIQAFTEIRSNSPLLIPFMLLMVVSIAIPIVMFANIDYTWYVDYMVELHAGDGSEEKREGIRRNFEMMSATTLGGLGVAFALVMTPMMLCLYACYFFIISNIKNDGLSFKNWLSFSACCFLPSLVGMLSIMVTIFLSDKGQFPLADLDPLSLNELLFGLESSAANKLSLFLGQVNITVFWTVALMTIGYAQWTGKNIVSSFLITIVPSIIHYGILYMVS